MYRNRGLLFPLVLIAIGIIVLLANTGVLSPQALERLGDLWPLLLVILGLQLILNHTLPRQQATLIGLGATAVIVVAAVAYAALAPAAPFGIQRFDSSEQLGGLSEATLDINYGAAPNVQLHAQPRFSYEKTGDETLGQLRRRNARIAADDHYFRMEQVSVGPGNAVVGFLVQVCRINPSNIIGTKAFPVHDFTCFLSLSGTGLCIVSQRRLVAQNRSRSDQC